MEEDNVVAEEVEQPTEVETSEPTDQEGGAEPSEQEETPASPAAEPEPKRNKVQERIDEITRARRQAEQEAEYWRKVATGEIKPPPQQEAQPQGDFIPPGYPAEPTLDAFDDYDQYNRALVRWEAGRIIAERDHAAEQEKAKNAQKAVHDSHAARVKAAKETKYSDWDELALVAPPMAFSDDAFSAILESDQSADIAYHLFKNPAEITRLNGLSRVQQIKEVTRLEDKFKATPQPVKRVSQAPTPLNPIGEGGDPAPKDPDKMSDEEWLAYERKRLAALGRRY